MTCYAHPIYFGFVCLHSVALGLSAVLHFLSAGNIIPYLFCQANMERRGCLCDLQVFGHEYLIKLWLSAVGCVTAAVLFTRTGTKWPNSSLKARRSTYMQIIRRWEHELSDASVPCSDVVYCPGVLYFPARSHFPRAGRKDHLDILCAHAGGMQAPLEVRSGEPGFL